MLQSKTRLYLLSVLTFLTFMDLEIASAAWNSSISFTTEERDSHVRQIQKVIETASSCLDTDLDTQQRVYQQYGVSPFYGDRSFFGKLSYEDKFQELYRVFLEKGYREKEASLLARHFRETMEPTSCVGLVLKCLGRGFKAAGQADLWARIRAYTDANGSDGTSLQNALQMLGWRVLYWNPWTAYNERWDQIERSKDPENQNRFWGWHSYRWSTVQKTGSYFWNKVDDASTLVDFGTRVPQEFTKVPFFVGTAHTGYHVFPGHYGKVVEGHSTRQITDSQTIESAPFNPLADGGAPRGHYYSGLIAVPPGY